MFCEFKMPSIPVVVPGHSCECGVCRKVLCFHLEGIKFSIATYIHYNYTYCCTGPPKCLDIQFCSCEEDAITLMRLQYWPATPVRPSTAFSFQLLDWLEALLLECQVSLHDVSAAVQFLNDKKVVCEVSIIIIIIVYKIIILMYNRGYNRLCILALLMHLKSTGIIK